jgi:methylglutaconyl-CoA hydratase
MSHFETLTLSREERGVARLTLNRPEKHNALDSRMIRELTEASRLLAADQAMRIVVLAAAGKSFCAGADLAWMQKQFQSTREERMGEAKALASMLQALDELPQFLVGLVHGPTYGGGVGLAAVCDMVIAGPAARFALSETRLGLIPATIVPYLIRRIGTAALRRYGLTGEAFGGTEAKVIGLVSELVGEGLLDGAAERQIGQGLASAPGAVAAAKRLFKQAAMGEIHAGDTIKALADRWETAEAQEGIAAFFNKEKPPWHR